MSKRLDIRHLLLVQEHSALDIGSSIVIRSRTLASVKLPGSKSMNSLAVSKAIANLDPAGSGVKSPGTSERGQGGKTGNRPLSSNEVRSPSPTPGHLAAPAQSAHSLTHGHHPPILPSGNISPPPFSLSSFHSQSSGVSEQRRDSFHRWVTHNANNVTNWSATFARLIDTSCIAAGYNIETNRCHVPAKYNLDSIRNQDLFNHEMDLCYFRDFLLSNKQKLLNFSGKTKDDKPLLVTVEIPINNPTHTNQNNNNTNNILSNENPNSPLIGQHFLGQARERKGALGNRTLVRTVEQDHRLLLHLKTESSATVILQTIVKQLPEFKDSVLTEIPKNYSLTFNNEVSNFESDLVVKKHKFGVLLHYKNQTELEMYNNTQTKLFEDFALLLGNKIELNGWTRYNGGLDVEGESNGKYSVYNVVKSKEVMFHVSPMMPLVEGDHQQIERKRHVGNDVVVIIFTCDEDANVNVQNFRSKFNHAFILVRPLNNEPPIENFYIEVVCKPEIPMFGPPIPEPPIIPRSAIGEFICIKAINAERATMRSPAFESMRRRAREGVLDSIIKKLNSSVTSPISLRLSAVDLI